MLDAFLEKKLQLHSSPRLTHTALATRAGIVVSMCTRVWSWKDEQLQQAWSAVTMRPCSWDVSVRRPNV